MNYLVAVLSILVLSSAVQAADVRNHTVGNFSLGINDNNKGYLAPVDQGGEGAQVTQEDAGAAQSPSGNSVKKKAQLDATQRGTAIRKNGVRTGIGQSRTGTGAQDSAGDTKEEKELKAESLKIAAQLKSLKAQKDAIDKKIALLQKRKSEIDAILSR